MSEQLKTCPFCGLDKAEMADFGGQMYAVRCRHCGASANSGTLYRTLELAIAAWNCRAACPSCASLRAENERLRDELRKPKGCTYDTEGRPLTVCHELATLRSEADRVHKEHAEMIDGYEATIEEYERRIEELTEALELNHKDKHYVEGLRQGYDDARKDRDLEVERLRGLLRDAGRRHNDPSWQAAVWAALGYPGNHPNAMNKETTVQPTVVEDWGYCECAGCANKANHSVNCKKMCCECYVKAGHPPVDWHADCMQTADNSPADSNTVGEDVANA